MVVAGIDIGARERHVVEAPLDSDITQQADDRRQLEADGDARGFRGRRRRSPRPSPGTKRDGLLPVDDLQRLVRRVEENVCSILATNSARRLPRCQGTGAVNALKTSGLAPVTARICVDRSCLRCTRALIAIARPRRTQPAPARRPARSAAVPDAGGATVPRLAPRHLAALHRHRGTRHRVTRHRDPGTAAPGTNAPSTLAPGTRHRCLAARSTATR